MGFASIIAAVGGVIIGLFSAFGKKTSEVKKELGDNEADRTLDYFKIGIVRDRFLREFFLYDFKIF